MIGRCLQDTSAARTESYMIAVITDLTQTLVKRNGGYGSHESMSLEDCEGPLRVWAMIKLSGNGFLRSFLDSYAWQPLGDGHGIHRA
jgi:hypothetical protein